MSFRAAFHRKPLVVSALLVAGVKVCQFAVDSTPLFFPDSGAFIGNALGVAFVSFRSYFYGWVIRLVAVPAESLTALVAFQVFVGGATAWLVAAALRRYFQVRPWIAAVCALLFAFDPMQIVHERMVMTETAALLGMTALLLSALEYLRSRKWIWLVLTALAGVILVGFRIVYLPPVLVTAVVLPIAPYIGSYGRVGGTRRIGPALTALLVSSAVTFVCHTGYRHLTGYLGDGEPVYSDWAGFFQLASVAPLLKPDATDVPWIAQLITSQETSPIPLSHRGWRSRHLWDPGGFVDRLIAGFGGNVRAAEREAGSMFRRTATRDPAGVALLAAGVYRHYWSDLRWVRGTLRHEVGLSPKTPLDPEDATRIADRFGLDMRRLHELQTPARRYYVFSRWWCVVLLLVPFLSIGALWAVTPQYRLAVGCFAVWNWLVVIAVCFGTVDPVYRYLHPFSFTGAVAIGLLLERGLRRPTP